MKSAVQVMRYAGAMLLATFCATLVGARREILQLESPELVASSGYTYYDDYTGEPEEICYAPIEVLLALNETQTQNLGFFLTGLLSTGVVDLLINAETELTVFAPTDAAFSTAAQTLNLTSTELLESPLLIPILLYHILPVRRLVQQILDGEILLTTLEESVTAVYVNGTRSGTTTLAGRSVDLVLEATESEAVAVQVDICNCDLCTTPIHVIDEVLLPQILSYSVDGSEVSVVLGDGHGNEILFVIIYPDIAASPGPTAQLLPTAAPAVSRAAPKTGGSPGGAGLAPASGPAAAPAADGSTSSSSASPPRKTTSAGLSYYSTPSLTD